MTDAQHLIENAIMALQRGKEFQKDINTEFTYCTIAEAKNMAQHIVYSLYDGLFPDDVDFILELLDDLKIDWREAKFLESHRYD